MSSVSQIAPFTATARCTYLNTRLTKRRMLLSAVDLVELFAITHGQRPRHHSLVLVARPGDGCICSCVTFPSFEAYGRFVEEPYMQLEAGAMRWGFGLRKAITLALEADIKGFAARY